MYHIPRYFSREYTNRDLDKSPNHLVLRIMLKSCSVKIGLCFSEIAHQFFTNPNIIFCHFTVIFGFLKTPWKVSKDVCFIKNNVVFMLIIINKWDYRNLEKHLTYKNVSSKWTQYTVAKSDPPSSKITTTLK